MPPTTTPAANTAIGVKRYEQDVAYIKRYINQITSYLKCSLVELVFVLSFNLCLPLGKIINLVSSEDEVNNYFNDKRNFLNQYLVKQGWAWTTIVIIAYYSILLRKQYVASISNLSKIDTSSYHNPKTTILRALVNYIISTIWWIFFTQWFFGFPIMDKIFVITGGKCVNMNEGNLRSSSIFQDSPHLFDKIEKLYESVHLSSYSCRKLKGSWEGGHDPSGHVFLMVHSSLYLFFETLPFYPPFDTFKNSVMNTWNNLKTSHGWKAKSQIILEFVIENPQVLVFCLTGLWWWMLLMTSIYFHSILEKFVGLLFGHTTFALLYYVPKLMKSKKITKERKSI